MNYDLETLIFSVLIAIGSVLLTCVAIVQIARTIG